MPNQVARAGRAGALAQPDRVTDNYEANVLSWHRSLRAANRSPLTLLSYAKATKQLYAYLSAQGMPRDVEYIRREHVEAFIASLQDAGKAEATVAQHWRSLKAWFNWMAGDDRINASPMRRMHAPRVLFKEVPELTNAEIERLMASAPSRSFTDTRDRALISMFVTTGMRLSEMAGLEYPDDVDLDARLVTLVGKGNRQRRAKFSHEAATHLDRYIVLRGRHGSARLPALWLGQDGALTPSGIYQVIKRRAFLANVEMHPHMTRHTFAGLWLRNGGSEQDLMEQLGWESAKMLQRYGRATRAARRNEHYDNFAPKLGRR